MSQAKKSVMYTIIMVLLLLIVLVILRASLSTMFLLFVGHKSMATTLFPMFVVITATALLDMEWWGKWSAILGTVLVSLFMSIYFSRPDTPSSIGSIIVNFFGL